jgi:hypothetical protein
MGKVESQIKLVKLTIHHLLDSLYFPQMCNEISGQDYFAHVVENGLIFMSSKGIKNIALVESQNSYSLSKVMAFQNRAFTAVQLSKWRFLNKMVN